MFAGFTSLHRYGFNGMESDFEIHNSAGTSYDFGARMYDPRLGRWLSLDPLQSEYPSLSPYNFVANNPNIYVDVDGRKFVTYIKVLNESTGKTETQKVTFDGVTTTVQTMVDGKPSGKVSTYTGGNAFVDNIITSYNYIVENGADVDDALKQVASSDIEIEVREEKNEGEYADGVISYDFSKGLQVTTDEDGKKENGIQSPALGFWSEAYHAFIDKIDIAKKNYFEKNDDALNSKEEEYVHVEKETKVIDALKAKNPSNNEKKRNTYGDGWKNVKTKGTTSTEKQ